MLSGPQSTERAATVEAIIMLAGGFRLGLQAMLHTVVLATMRAKQVVGSWTTSVAACSSSIKLKQGACQEYYRSRFLEAIVSTLSEVNSQSIALNPLWRLKRYAPDYWMLATRTSSQVHKNNICVIILFTTCASTTRVYLSWRLPQARQLQHTHRCIYHLSE